MPPALSDIESSDDEQVPAQKSLAVRDGKPAAEQVEESEHGSDEEGPDEYVVEKIIGHKFVKGDLVFNVKWQGYDDPQDRTWEPESNMDGAADVLNEYFDEIGGRPEPKTGQKRKGRASSIAKSEESTPVAKSAPKRSKKEWTPPPGSWEHDVSEVDTIEEGINPKTGQLTRFAYLVWNNGKKTQHPLKHVNQKCPQKMLLYYEAHLTFTHNENLKNGGEDGDNIKMNDGV